MPFDLNLEQMRREDAPMLPLPKLNAGSGNIKRKFGYRDGAQPWKDYPNDPATKDDE